jgi:hypothetical protein
VDATTRKTLSRTLPGIEREARARRELEAASREDPRAVEHAFDLLSLGAPDDHLQLAYGALRCGDSYLQGVALEYIDVVLPPDLRTALAARLTASPPSATPRSERKPVDDLLRSKAAIELKLEELRRTSDPDG